MFNIVLFSAGLFLSLRCHRYRCCPFTLQRKSSWYRTLEIRTKECKSLYISNITHTIHPYFRNIKLHTHHRLRNDHICTFVPCQRVGTLALTGLFWYTLLATLLKELSKLQHYIMSQQLWITHLHHGRWQCARSTSTTPLARARLDNPEGCFHFRQNAKRMMAEWIFQNICAHASPLHQTISTNDTTLSKLW